MKHFDRLAGESARDYAFKVLKANIISLDLKPGTLISENEISAELGISRTPLREAIIDLAKASIIETYPQKGNFVALIDSKMVEEARFLRRVLDTAVIEAACESTEDSDLKNLEDNVSLQEFYLEKGNAEKIFELDNQFHKAIYTAAKKDIIYEMSSTMMIHFDRVRTLSVETVKDLKIVGDHREMLEAIKNHDKETALLLVNRHLARYQFDEENIKKKAPELFKH